MLMSQVVLGYLLGRRIHIVQSVTVNPPSREQVWFHMVTTHRSCLAAVQGEKLLRKVLCLLHQVFKQVSRICFYV
jgi:hypothetical protein